MFFFDPIYFVFVAPGFLLAALATILTKSTFAKYSNVASSKRITGAQAAREMLQRHGIRGVNIEPTQGQLTDHYDPTTQTLRLSQGVLTAIHFQLLVSPVTKQDTLFNMRISTQHYRLDPPWFQQPICQPA